MKDKLLVSAIAILFLSAQGLMTAFAEGENNVTTYNANQVVVESASDLNLGGSFVGHGSPNLVTRGVSLNIDGLTNAGDAFNILNRGDGSANFTRNLDSVGYLTNDNYIQNSLQYNRARAQAQAQYKQRQTQSGANVNVNNRQ